MLGGWCAGQARPVRPPCAGGGQYAGQATMCWGGGGTPVGRGWSGHHVLEGQGTRVARRSGEAGRPPGWHAGQARPVRPSYA